MRWLTKRGLLTKGVTTVVLFEAESMIAWMVEQKNGVKSTGCDIIERDYERGVNTSVICVTVVF